MRHRVRYGVVMGKSIIVFWSGTHWNLCYSTGSGIYPSDKAINLAVMLSQEHGKLFRAVSIDLPQEPKP